jgi:hypothetical protein
MLGWNGAAPISAAQAFKSVALGYPSDQRNDYATIHTTERAAEDIEGDSAAAKFSQPRRLSANSTPPAIDDPNKQFNGAIRSFGLFLIVQQERARALGTELCAHFSPLLWQR